MEYIINQLIGLALLLVMFLTPLIAFLLLHKKHLISSNTE